MRSFRKKIRNLKTDTMAWFSSKDFKQLMVFVLVVVSFSLSIVYTNVKTYNPQLAAYIGHNDSIDYVKMYFGEPVWGIRAYRPLVPLLARLVPDLPDWLFTGQRSFDLFTRVAMKFGIVNFFFLLGACVALYFLQRGFGMSYFESFLGGMLFLSSQTVIRSAGLPLADTAFFFFFLLCMISIQRNNLWWLLFAHTIGVLAKELVILSIPLILLSLFPWRRKAGMLFVLVPGLLLYGVVRVKFALSPLDDYITGGTLRYCPTQLLRLITPNGLINVFLSFGFAWIPALYALARCKIPLLLKRWSWLILIIFMGVLLGRGDLGRSTFNAFPVVIPLASLGLSCWLKKGLEEKGRFDEIQRA